MRCSPLAEREIQTSIMPPARSGSVSNVSRWSTAPAPPRASLDELHDLAWIGITGVSQRGRFRLRDANGKTRVTFRLSYESAGSVLGLIADRVAARQVARNMTATLKNLARLAEA